MATSEALRLCGNSLLDGRSAVVCPAAAPGLREGVQPRPSDYVAGRS
jgi:hypothetical protein